MAPFAVIFGLSIFSLRQGVSLWSLCWPGTHVWSSCPGLPVLGLYPCIATASLETKGRIPEKKKVDKFFTGTTPLSGTNFCTVTFFWPKWHVEGRVYIGLWVQQRVYGGHGSFEGDMAAVSQITNPTQKAERETKWDVGQGYKLSKLAPSTILSSSKVAPLKGSINSPNGIAILELNIQIQSLGGALMIFQSLSGYKLRWVWHPTMFLIPDWRNKLKHEETEFK